MSSRNQSPELRSHQSTTAMLLCWLLWCWVVPALSLPRTKIQPGGCPDGESCDVCGSDMICITRRGEVRRDLTLGYNDVLTIPRRATKIHITDSSNSDAVFAVRSKEKIYFVNVRHTQPFPTAYKNVAGTTFFYHHPLFQKSGREILEAAGPTNMTLHLMALHPHLYGYIKIRYKYLIPGRRRRGRFRKFTQGQGLLSSRRKNKTNNFSEVRRENIRRKPEPSPGLDVDREKTENVNRVPENGRSHFVSLPRGRGRSRSRSAAHHVTPIRRRTSEQNKKRTQSNSNKSSKYPNRKTEIKENSLRHFRPETSSEEEHVLARNNPSPVQPPRIWDNLQQPFTPVPHELGSFEGGGLEHNESYDSENDTDPSRFVTRETELPRTGEYNTSETGFTGETTSDITFGPTMYSPTETVQTTEASKESQPGLFKWVVDNKAHCRATCEGSVAEIRIRCIRWDGLEVKRSNCDGLYKPDVTKAKCPNKPCRARWVPRWWGPCSATCGRGQQVRSVRCWKMFAPGFDSTVHSFMCQGSPKPRLVRACWLRDCGPLWEMSEWGQCTSRCGPGVKRRDIRCSTTDQPCNDTSRPIEQQTCNHGPCEATWAVSKWTKCSGPCGEGVRRRKAVCRAPGGEIVHDSFCDERERPLTILACGEEGNCTEVWVPQDWGVCSVPCGNGVTHRRVICGGVVDNQFNLRPDDACGNLTKPHTHDRCLEPSCGAQWYYTEWSKCSVTCGRNGQRVRLVTCYDGERPSDSCNPETRPTEREGCPIIPCPVPIKGRDIS